MENMTGEEQARAIILMRIGFMELKSTERLTPLLRKEMQHITVTHREAFEQPTLSMDVLHHLDDLDKRFREHWEAFHRDYMSHMMLFVRLAGLEDFLRRTLLEDYVGIPQGDIESDFELDMVTLIRAQRSGKDDDDSRKRYQEEVVIPCQELTVDLSYVEDRLCLAAGGKEERPRGYLMHLVERCRWEELARALLNDRQLARDFIDHQPFTPTGDFLGHQPFRPSRQDADIGEVVLWKIEDLEQRFFEVLISPEDFRLTKLARELPDGNAILKSDEYGVPLILERVRSSSESAWVDRTRSVLGAVVRGIKALGTGASRRSRTNSSIPSRQPDEKTPLFESKEV